MQPPKQHPLKPLAVVGYALHYPTDATTPSSFWEMLMTRKCATGPYPADRLNISAHHNPTANRTDTLSVTGGHFLNTDLAAFDAPFFNLTATEAEGMDPQQRLALETAYLALESAGISLDKIDGSKTCVFSGSSGNDYGSMHAKDPQLASKYAAYGQAMCMIANRISWAFNLKGPSANVDTACSSSLYALDMACQSIWSGASEMGLALGVNLIITREWSNALDNLGFFSQDNRCFSFDEKANGYSRGEGLGALVIKPLEDAVRDGDTIRAVIRSTLSNQDGRTPGITQPARTAQQKLIAEAYSHARLSPDKTRYFEAHGTGTAVGDPTETRAIGAVFREYRTVEEPLYLGSVKSNIGHLEGGSGIAGVIKTILSLEKGIIPPVSDYFESLNPRIDAEHFHLKVVDQAIVWPEGLRRASVSSFGFGGANSHVILDDAYHVMKEMGIEMQGKHCTVVSPQTGNGSTALTHTNGASGANGHVHVNGNGATNKSDMHLLTWSAADKDGLSRQSQAWEEYSYPDLPNLAYTLNERRTHHAWRTFALAAPNSTGNEIVSAWSSAAKALVDSKIAFVFTGQGAQWPAMGRELAARYPLYAESLREAGIYLRSLGAEWDVLDVLTADKGKYPIDEPAFAQPLCTATQIALIDLLQTFGVKPTAVVGHSSGEIAAAYAAGAISRLYALKAAYLRGVFAAKLVTSSTMNGGMLAVSLSPDEVKPYLDDLKKANYGTERVVIACYNSPKSITLSGDRAQLEYLQNRLQENIPGVLAKLLPVPVGYHSFQTQEVAGGYAAALGDDLPTPKSKPKSISQSETKAPMVSSVTGTWASKDELCKAAYWVKNLVSPVRFVDAVDKFHLGSSSAQVVKKLDGSHRENIAVDIFFEIGPHAALRGPCRDTLQGKGTMEYISALTRNKNAVETLLLSSLGRLHCLGYALSFSSINPTPYKAAKKVLTDLPQYAFNHTKTYWQEGLVSKGFRFRKFGRHELLGWPEDDWNPLQPKWRNLIKAEDPSWVRDHVIEGVTILPGASMLTMAIEAMKQVTATDQGPETEIAGFELKNVNFRAALKAVPGTEGVHTRFHLHPPAPGSDSKWFGFQLSSFDGGWVVNCDGCICVQTSPSGSAGAKEESLDLGSMAKACKTTFETESFYRMLIGQGYQFGPAFVRLAAIAANDANTNGEEKDQALTTITPYPSPTPTHWSEAYTIHPTTLDGFMQTVAALRSRGGTRKAPSSVPRYVERVWVAAGMTERAREEGGMTVGTRIESVGRQECESTICAHGASVRIDGVVFANIGEGVEEDEDREEVFRAQGITWKPDLGSMTADEIQAYCVGNLEEQATPVQSLQTYVDALAHKEPTMKILSFGSKLGLAEFILQTLRVEGQVPRFAKLDVSGEEIDVLQKELGEYADRVGKVDIDLEKPGTGEYDLVVLDMQTEPGKVLKNVHALLKPSGTMVFTQPGKQRHTFAVGLNEGWWTGQTKSEKNWSSLLQENEFSDTVTFEDEGISIVVSSRETEAGNEDKIVVIHNPDVLAQKELARRLSDTVYTLDEALTADIKETVVIINELGTPVLADIEETMFQKLQRLFTSPIQKFLWVNDTSPTSRAIDGLFRVLNSELSKSFATLSLENIASPKNASLILRALNSSNPETESIEHSGIIHIPRLTHSPAVSTSLTNHFSKTPILLRWSSEPALKLSIKTPGLLDSLHFIPDTDRTRPLPPHMLEVKVKAAGVNFRDILIMLGRMDQDTVGFECAGIVTRVGSDCGDFKVGDCVLGCEFDTYRSYARLQKDTAVRISEGMSFAQAAAASINFVTAWHALVVLGRVQPGSKILIHSAAGGTGQAAVQVAQYFGAEVFATVGSEKKRTLLKEEYGIPDDHIFSSRNLDFVSGMKALTSNQGADIIMNSLSGDALAASWELIASYGQFVEIGKRDIVNHRPLDMAHFERNVTFSAIDVAMMVQERPEMVGRALRAVMPLLDSGKLRLPSPQAVFGIGEMEAGLRSLQGGLSAGKVVLEMRDDDLVKAIPSQKQQCTFSPDATYVIAGGLGGLGKGIARWMVSCGARNLVLLSRKGAQEQDAPFLSELSAKQVNVFAPPCDITDRSMLEAVLGAASHRLPPVRGCIQATMVLQDTIFETMTHAQWSSATRPKITGSWNLHTLLPGKLDFFIMMSSISSIIGNRGQANYAAANSFMDGLASYRRSNGQVGTALNLGLFVDAGVATQDPEQREKYLANLPFRPVSEAQLFALLGFHCAGRGEEGQGQTVFGLEPSKGKVWNKDVHTWLARPSSSYFSQTHSTGSSEQGQSQSKGLALNTDLTSSSPEQATAALTTLLVSKLSAVLGVGSDEFDVSKPMHAYGVDSLVAVEIRNWFAKEVKAEMAIFDLLGGTSIEGVAGLAVSRVRGGK